jgi:hypothetical protein
MTNNTEPLLVLGMKIDKVKYRGKILKTTQKYLEKGILFDFEEQPSSEEQKSPKKLDKITCVLKKKFVNNRQAEALHLRSVIWE